MFRLSSRYRKAFPTIVILLLLLGPFQNCRGRNLGDFSTKNDGTTTSGGPVTTDLPTPTGTASPTPTPTPSPSAIPDPCPGAQMGSPEMSELYLVGSTTIATTLAAKSGYTNNSGNQTTQHGVEVKLIKTNVIPANICQQRVAINCSIVINAGATGIIWGTTNRVPLKTGDFECVTSSNNLDIDVPGQTVTTTPDKATITIRPKEQTPDITSTIHVCMQGSIKINVKLRNPYNKDSVTRTFNVDFTNSCPVEQKVNAETEAELQGGLGETVSISGTKAAILNPGMDSYGMQNVGATRIYELGTGTWSHITTVIPPSAELQNDIKPSTLLLSGDNLFIGANAISIVNTGTLSLAGRVWWYQRNTSGLWNKVLTIDGTLDKGKFGSSFAFDGTNLFIGAPSLSSNGNVFVYTLSGASATLTATIPGPDVKGAFGTSIAVSGTRLLIGAPGGTTSTGNFFDCETTTISAPTCTKWPLISSKLGGEIIPVSAKLGSAVAIKGTDAVVAASEWFTGSTAPNDRNGLVAFIALGPTTGSANNIKILKGGSKERYGSSLAFGSTSFFVGANLAMGYRGLVDQFTIPADSTVSPILKFRYYGLEASPYDRYGTAISATENGSEAYLLVGAPVDQEQSFANAGSGTFFKIISP
jgi:hypothetical protein